MPTTRVLTDAEKIGRMRWALEAILKISLWASDEAFAVDRVVVTDLARLGLHDTVDVMDGPASGAPPDTRPA